jgi:hypothetical protein
MGVANRKRGKAATPANAIRGDATDKPAKPADTKPDFDARLIRRDESPNEKARIAWLWLYVWLHEQPAPTPHGSVWSLCYALDGATHELNDLRDQLATLNLSGLADLARESREWCVTLSKRLGGNAATSEPASHELWCEVNDFDGLERLQRSLDDARERVRKMERAAQQRSEPTPTQRSATKLPSLGPHDMKAWQMHQVGKHTQTQIAAELSRVTGTRITQARVSEMIARAKANAEASGLGNLARGVTAPRARIARTLDPVDAELGHRTDGRAAHLTEKARQIAREE